MESEKVFIPMSFETQHTLETVFVSPLNGDGQTKTCRLCASETDLAIPIYGENADSHRGLADKINQHLPIKVSPEDDLPLVVCCQCESTVLAFDELLQVCKRADHTLRARLNVATSPPQVEQTNTEANHSHPREGGASDRDSDDSDRPLAALARHPLSAFLAALEALRAHAAAAHAPPAPSDDGASGGERDVAAFDDLSARNGRRGRLDAETRARLAAARTTVGGATRFRCDACGKLLSSAHTLVQHARIHSGERPCVCDVCGKRFRAANGLRRHLAETHARARRPACAACARTFANSHNLKLHMRTHTGERPHACPACGRRFAHRGSLHSHLATHSPTRAHRCADCGARFRLRAGLRRHARRHAGLEPRPAGAHACPACRAIFRSRRALAHHARRDHPPERAPPPY